MAGMITATSIEGSLNAKNIAMGVLTQANKMSKIAGLFQSIPVPELTCTIPVAKPGAVDEDLDELEISQINTGNFTHVDFSLKKDRIKLAATDESGYKSKAGDPLAIQKTASAAELARILDKKVVAALQTTPQTGATGAIWSTVTNSPLNDIATAVAAIGPYPADFVAMPAAVHAKYLATNVIASIGTGNPQALAGCVGTVPGYNLPIFIDENITAKSAIVGSAQGMAAVIGNGPVKVRQWDSPGEGATIYQMDVYRQVKAPIFLNDSNLNQAVYQITGVIA